MAGAERVRNAVTLPYRRGIANVMSGHFKAIGFEMAHPVFAAAASGRLPDFDERLRLGHQGDGRQDDRHQ
ncbi:hypothetical protein D3C86_1467430 [compost metagenome]